MDGELLRWLYHRFLHDPVLARTRDCTYADGLILLIHFYGVIFHRSGHWACEPRNWPIGYRRLKLPSYSQWQQRIKTPRILQWIERVDAEVRDRLPGSDLKFADGKPLVVSGFSKDRDATTGYVPGGYARGYKVHLLIDSLGRIERFGVTGLHAGEPTVMTHLLRNADLRGQLIRADSNYDAKGLYGRIADRGGRLIAPRKKPFTGLGHHRHHPDRLRAIAELEASRDAMRTHRRIRAQVERQIGHLTNLPSGLWALPGFVRRLQRVRRWVAAKILLYNLNLLLRLASTAAA